VALGLYMTNTGKTGISTRSEHAVHHIWGYFGFVAETLIFTLTGVIMGDRVLHPDNTIEAVDYAKVLGTYLVLHVIRFLMILLFWPLLSKLGYGMSFNQVILCSYAGLRGAVGLSLALIVV
jgi:sodium/hydrogen exchanger 10/11